jgi:hypothetical protein
MNPDESVKPDDVEECRCCKNARINEGKPARLLFAVSMKGLPDYLLCDFCDGDALRMAKDKEAKRMASGE